MEVRQQLCVSIWKGLSHVAFKGAITRLSELIADVITGATINGGTINGTVINGGDINGTTIDGGTITGSDIIGAIIQTDTLSPYIKMWKDTFGRNRIDFAVSGLSSFQKGTILAQGEDGVSNPTLFLQSPDNNAVAPDQAQAILRSGDLTAAFGSGYPEFDANTTEARFKYLRIFADAWIDNLKVGGTGSNKRILDLDAGNEPGQNVVGGDGHITIAHELGSAPDIVIWCDNNGNNPYIGRHATGSDTATTFRIIFRKTTDNTVAPNGTNMGGSWIAANLG